jgi:hypothetical protein
MRGYKPSKRVDDPWQPPASADDRLWPETGPSEDKPTKTGQGGPFHPTQEDIQAYSEMSERGAFLPTIKTGLTPPARKRRGKWGSK